MNQQEQWDQASGKSLTEIQRAQQAMHDQDSQESVEVKRYIATVTLTLPNRKVGSNYMPGAMILAKQAVTTEMVDQEWIDVRVKDGYLFEEKTKAPTFKEVRQAVDGDETLNVSSVIKDGVEDNPLDDGIDLVPKGDDPALEARLNEIVAEQEEQGIENDDKDLAPEQVEINAETGEVTRTGGEIDVDDGDDDEQADAQVS